MVVWFRVAERVTASFDASRPSNGGVFDLGIGFEKDRLLTVYDVKSISELFANAPCVFSRRVVRSTPTGAGFQFRHRVRGNYLPASSISVPPASASADLPGAACIRRFVPPR